MSFAISPGTSVERMLQELGREPAQPEPVATEPAPAKRARVGGKFKADDPATPAVDEAWEPET
jgi:hypothetical protein